MVLAESFLNKLSKINQYNFESHALRLFHWQAEHNSIYSSYIKNLGINTSDTGSIDKIPFLPISFYKEHAIKTNDWMEEKVFESSGTTGKHASKHYIRDISFYHSHALHHFENEFGRIDEMHVLALLPSYLERDNSSLISMVQHLITESGSDKSGFYLDNYDELVEVLVSLKNDKKKTVLFGVTFALLDLAEKYNVNLSHVTLIETGGMKGRREELTREELYKKLNHSLHFGRIYSEYGMTELLSQAYGKNAQFKLPDCMKVVIREVNDPFSQAPLGKTGGINVIDLANVHTCAFIETQDLGRQFEDGTFEVLGRFDNSELRGCNLLVS